MSDPIFVDIISSLLKFFFECQDFFASGLFYFIIGPLKALWGVPNRQLRN